MTPKLQEYERQVVAAMDFDRVAQTPATAGGAQSPSAAIAADNAAKLALLSPRELAVLVLTAKGCGWKECATRLGLTHNTVQNYRRDLYRKLDVGSACEAAVIAAKAGLV